uniref:Fibronectin type-III domain-containing protein n=1 Tax=Romanomermis culicivorax TaxID=13658 RepID=A0A915KSR9_ROMCU
NETSENRIAFKTNKNFKLIPGLSYRIAIASIKKSELSNPVVLGSTLPPLSMTNLSIVSDFQNLGFIVSAYLADVDHSFQDSCFLRYSNSDDNQIPSIDENLDVKGILTVEEKVSACIWPKLLLSPGNVYDFRLWTKSGSTRSEITIFSRIAVRPAFDYQKFGLSIFPGDSKIDIRWDKDRVDKIWPQIVGRDATLTVRLNNISEEVNPTLQSNLIVGNLVPGHCYPYMIYSLNSGLISREKFDSSLRTNPSNFVVQALNVTSSSVYLAINPEQINSDSKIDTSCVLSFLLKSDAWESGRFQEYKRILPLKSDGISIENLNFLKPYTKYNVSGKIICGSAGSSCANSSIDIPSISFTTKEGTPDKLLWLHVTSLSPSVILVEWAEPANKNGLILDYVITLESKYGVILETAPALENRHILHNTIGGTTYTVNVRARTAAGMGDSYCALDKDGSCNNFTVTTQISVPPKPQGKVEIVTNAVQTTVFTITYNWTMFSTDNGPLIGYAIIVAEGEVPTEIGDNLTWFDVQKVNAVWPAYVAVYKPLPNERFFPSTPNYDVIGVNRPECSSMRYPNNNNNKIKRSDEEKTDEITERGFTPTENKRPYPNFVCNGPLKSGTKYRVKLRIFTSASLYADSDYSDVVVTLDNRGFFSKDQEKTRMLNKASNTALPSMRYELENFVGAEYH